MAKSSSNSKRQPSVLNWMGTLILYSIPGVNLIFLILSAIFAKSSGKRGFAIAGILLMLLCAVLVFAAFALFLLFPSAFSDYTIATETYVLMAVWSLLGLLFFHMVIRKDSDRKFGKAIIVWLALLIFIVLMAMTWAERVNEERETTIFTEISNHIDASDDSKVSEEEMDRFLENEFRRLHNTNNTGVFVITGLFGLALVIMVTNYNSMQKWEKKAARERDEAKSIVQTDPLTGVKSKHAFLVNQKKIDEATQLASKGTAKGVVEALSGKK